MDLLSRYHLYLYALGYKIDSVNDKHCSITDYVNAVHEVASLESVTVEELADNIDFVFDLYKKGGEKNYLLSQNNNGRTLNGLEHFKEFILLCNKR
ncbi:MAG: hypothetical protein IK015_10955 [Treponema sp.]|nr:hypothetical protein [Treponema sp.]